MCQRGKENGLNVVMSREGVVLAASLDANSPRTARTDEINKFLNFWLHEGNGRGKRCVNFLTDVEANLEHNYLYEMIKSSQDHDINVLTTRLCRAQQDMYNLVLSMATKNDVD